MYIPAERKKENLAEGPERQRGCKFPASKKYIYNSNSSTKKLIS
jgi:hypothetical protein